MSDSLGLGYCVRGRPDGAERAEATLGDQTTSADPSLTIPNDDGPNDDKPKPGTAGSKPTARGKLKLEANSYLQPRLNALNSFAVVATLVFASAVAELSAYDHQKWTDQPVWSGVYVVLISFSVGVSSGAAILSAVVEAAAQRVGSWDTWKDFDTQQGDEDVTLVNDNLDVGRVSRILRLTLQPRAAPKTAAEGWLAGYTLSSMVFSAIADGPRSPLGAYMTLFPWASLALIFAVCVRVMKDADFFVQIIVFTITGCTSFPAAFVAAELVCLLTH